MRMYIHTMKIKNKANKFRVLELNNNHRNQEMVELCKLKRQRNSEP